MINHILCQTKARINYKKFIIDKKKIKYINKIAKQIDKK